MIQSMTAFSQQQKKTGAGIFVWEIRSVNHRYLDIYLRIPDDFKFLEMDIRNLAKKMLKRGKIECSLRYKMDGTQSSELNINQSLVNEIIKVSQNISSMAQQKPQIDPVEILKWPGVVESNSIDKEAIKKQVLDLFQVTLSDLSDHRKREGQALCDVIQQKRLEFIAHIQTVRERMPELLSELKSKWQTRLTEFKEDVDSNRIEQEMLIMIQKLDIEEELDRLDAHVIELERILSKEEPAGRRLDFMMQEFNRESNTITSKSSDILVTQAGVDMKVLIEQMREQIQNIE